MPYFIIFGLILITVFALYVFMLRGRKNKKGLTKLKKYDYAHRGLHQKPHIPENSLSAFSLAAKLGYGAELDVHLLKDGNLAVIHDSSLVRTTGKEGVVENLTKEELVNYTLEGTSETIPTLEDILKIFENKTPLIIELKSYGGNHKALCKAVNDVLKNYRGDFCIESFDPRCLMWFKNNSPDIIRGQLSQNFIRNPSGLTKILNLVLTALLLNFLTKPDFIAYKFEDRKDLGNKICTKLLGLQGVSWTITNQSDCDTAKSEGQIVIFENFRP